MTTATPKQGTIYWVEDSGHAWLAVPLSLHPDAVDSGTGYGYIKDGVAYLEEDAEAPHFLITHGYRTTGSPRDFQRVYHPGESPVHRYPHIRAAWRMFADGQLTAEARRVFGRP